MSDIVQGRIPMMPYAPNSAIDLAADVIGHQYFYEMLALNPPAASRLIDVCRLKRDEVVQLQQQAAGYQLENSFFMPGVRISSMIHPFLSPKYIRSVIMPFNLMLAEDYGCCVAEIKHRDPSLLHDYLALPNLKGLMVPVDWPMEPVVEALESRVVFLANYVWHFHEGKTPKAPICDRWKDCLEQVSELAGRVRTLKALGELEGDTPREQRDYLFKDLEDLNRSWECRSSQ